MQFIFIVLCLLPSAPVTQACLRGDGSCKKNKNQCPAWKRRKRSLPFSLSKTELYKRPLDKFTDAICNDGSAAVYYLPKVRHLKEQTVLLYLGGEYGACYSPSSCKVRCENYPEDCSSSTMPDVWYPTLPILSGSPTENPGLFNSYKIVIRGCTNDVYSGTRDAGNETNGLHFRGRDVLEAVLQDLLANVLDMSGQRFQFVFAGSSAGAFGVAINCDYVSETLTQTIRNINPYNLVDARCIMDGIDFSNHKITTEGCDLTTIATEATIFWDSIPDTSCLVANARDPSPCLFFSTLLPYITTPFFLAVPYHDTDLLKRPCSPNQEDVRWKMEKAKLAIDLIEKHPKSGLFLSNCPHHISALSEVWDVLKVKASMDTSGEISFKTALANWLVGKLPHQVIDSPTEINPTCTFD